MGGNLFKGKTRRYEREEFLNLVNELHLPFSKISNRFKVTDFNEDKISFGDMDVLVVPKVNLSRELFEEVFGTTEIVHNGSIWSFVYRDFQIDCIICPEEEFQFSNVYFGRNDFGNFVGKIAHMLGTKFGHDGFWLPVRSQDDHVLGNILLTLDPDEALRFLDIRPEHSSMNEMFENIISSKYFNPSVFALENNNAVARVRDKKRPSYNAFLEYIKELPENNYFPRVKNKTIYLDMIFETFPVRDQYDKLFAEKEKRERVAAKFNGNIVSELTGETNKPLGDLMKEIKSRYTIDQLDRMGEENIQTMICNIFKEMNHD